MARSPATLTTLRLIPLAAVLALLAMLGVLAVNGMRFTATDTLWIALPLVLGVADLVLIPSVGSTVRPVPLGASAGAAQRISVGALRTVLVLRVALAEAPALFGLLASVITSSLVPYAIGAAFAVPLTLLYAYPSERVVDGVRQRLEVGGASSYLWESLRPRA
jgi:hypothetical protein